MSSFTEKEGTTPALAPQWALDRGGSALVVIVALSNVPCACHCQHDCVQPGSRDIRWHVLCTAAVVIAHQKKFCYSLRCAECLGVIATESGLLMQEGGRGMPPGSKGKEPDASKEKASGESGFGDRWTAG